MKVGILLVFGVLLVIALVLTNILYAEQMTPKISDVAKLHLAFADSRWDGKIIPEGQQCREFGGNGATPQISVMDIPPQANKLLLEFSDKTYKPCDNGGHGIISYQIIPGTEKIIVPSISGQTFKLPDRFSLVKEHCGAALGMDAGAYIGPCPGIGNLYYVTIKALYESPGKSTSHLLGVGRLDIGTYEQ